MVGFIGDLSVKLISDDPSGLWELLEPLSFSSASGKTITAPTGFRTDFMSVPRTPIIYDLLGNKARRAGVIHDKLYSSHELSREDSDAMLREMCLLDGLNHFEAEACYLAVRKFGQSHW